MKEERPDIIMEAGDSQIQVDVTSPVIKALRKSPVVSVDLTWHGLTAWVKDKYRPSSLIGHCLGTVPNKRKLVLNNVSGMAPCGTLTAIMGPSGAGKTTLLCALANRFPGDILGDIRINGWAVDGDMLRLSTFVPQQTLFIETLTTREHLEFMVGLQYPDHSSEYRSLRVNELLKELGLRSTASISSLSGGERKRLVFASQIVTDPPVLFCDEPTSGLDSHTAHTIISLLEQLAARGRTIICSIHQPASKTFANPLVAKYSQPESVWICVFSAFNNLLVLSDGRVAFMGKRQEAEQFFLSLGYRCPQNYNPADFYMQILHTGRGENNLKREDERIHKICDSFASSDFATAITHAIQKLNDSGNTSSYSNQVGICDMDVRRRRRISLFGTHWWSQLYWLTWRSWLDSIRNPFVHLIRTVHKVMTAILMALCFAHVKLDQKGIQDIEGALFILLTENNFPSCYAILNVFPQEIPLFMRDRSNELYRTDTYYVSKILSLIPGFFIEPFLFTTIAYWIIGLRPDVFAFLVTAIVLILTANVACAYGCLLSTAFESLDVSTALMIPINQILMVSAGLYINIKTIPSFITWIKYLSWMKYGNEALTIIQWQGITSIECGGRTVSSNNSTLPCVQSGEELISSFGFETKNLLWNVLLLILMACGLHLSAFICLWYRGQAGRNQHHSSISKFVNGQKLESPPSEAHVAARRKHLSSRFV